jgi:hypothetical protein
MNTSVRSQKNERNRTVHYRRDERNTIVPFRNDVEKNDLLLWKTPIDGSDCRLRRHRNFFHWSTGFDWYRILLHSAGSGDCPVTKNTRSDCRPNTDHHFPDYRRIRHRQSVNDFWNVSTIGFPVP